MTLWNDGWIEFDLAGPKSSSSSRGPKDAGIVIMRNETGQITGVETKNGFANGAQLLQLIAESLRTGGDIDFSISAGGEVNVKSSGSD